MAATNLHVFSQISTEEYKGPALQMLDLNTKTWQPMYAVDTPLAQPFTDNNTSAFVTFGIPAIIGILVLLCILWCVRRTRGSVKVIPDNIHITISSGLSPPSTRGCLPAYGSDDMEMGNCARVIRESEIVDTISANQTSSSPDLPAQSPPSYDDAISSAASTDGTTQLDSPHNSMTVHDASSSSITPPAAIDSYPP